MCSDWMPDWPIKVTNYLHNSETYNTVVKTRIGLIVPEPGSTYVGHRNKRTVGSRCERVNVRRNELSSDITVVQFEAGDTSCLVWLYLRPVILQTDIDRKSKNLGIFSCTHHLGLNVTWPS